MDPFYLSKLQIVLTDFFLAIQKINPEHIRDEASKTEWINLNNSFSYQKYAKYPEHEIISESTDIAAQRHVH